MIRTRIRLSTTAPFGARTLSRALIAGAALAAASASTPTALAGPLSPPPGPPSDTFNNLEYKTLRQVEPRFPINRLNAGAFGDFEISRPGSYYLTGNIGPAAGLPATISINTPGKVTIDLNGFTVEGAGFSGTGIGAFAGPSQITIRNGSIQRYDGPGVDVAENLVLEDGTIAECGNAADPAVRTAIGSRIERCQILRSPGRAIEAAESVLVAETEIIETGDTAVEFFGANCELRESRIRFCNGPVAVRAFDAVITLNEVADVQSGLEVFEGARVHRNVFSRGQGNAITAIGAHNVVEQNTVTEFNAAGILIDNNGFNNRVLGNDVSRCGVGIISDGRDNVIDENRSAESGVGVIINPGNNDLVTRNTAFFNAAANFNIGGGNNDAVIIVAPGGGFGLNQPWANFEF